MKALTRNEHGAWVSTPELTPIQGHVALDLCKWLEEAGWVRDLENEGLVVWALPEAINEGAHEYAVTSKIGERLTIWWCRNQFELLEVASLINSSL